ncbi:MAG TPA: hypothetical protein VI408_10900 [Gaiellaceae bacterium]
MCGDRCSLRLTRRYRATVAEVWEALLDGRWLGDARTSVRPVEHQRVAEIELAGSTARVELTREGDTTVLVLEHGELLAPDGMRAIGTWTRALDRLEVA